MRAALRAMRPSLPSLTSREDTFGAIGALHAPSLDPSVAPEPEVVPPLLEHVRARRGGQSIHLGLSALVQHAPEQALPPLVAALERDRLPVFFLVRRLGSARARAAPALASALLDDLHEGAWVLLLEMGPEARDAVPRLRQAFAAGRSSPASHFRGAVVQVLARIADPASIEALELATEDDRWTNTTWPGSASR